MPRRLNMSLFHPFLYFTWFSTGFILIQNLHIFYLEQHIPQSPFLKAILAHFYCKIDIKYFMQAKKIIVSFLCVLFNFKFWGLNGFGL